jgi:hypothetical protein
LYRIMTYRESKKPGGKKRLCLVGFIDIEEIDPFDFEHQENMDIWRILNKIEDVIVGTSITFTYMNSRF